MNEEIVNRIIEKLNIKEKIIGVLQYGSSLFENEMDEFSDIDLMFVIKDEFVIESGRGQIFIDKMEVEFFLETETEIYKDLFDELDTLVPINRNRFCTGKILIDTDNKLKAIKDRAMKMYSMPYTIMNLMDIKKNAISFFNRLNKLKRKARYKDKDYEFSYYRYVNELIEIYSRIYGLPIINDKLYKSLRDDDYRKKYLQYKISDDFCRKSFIKLIEEPNLIILEEVINYIFKQYIDTSKDYILYYYKEENKNEQGNSRIFKKQN